MDRIIGLKKKINNHKFFHNIYIYLIIKNLDIISSLHFDVNLRHENFLNLNFRLRKIDIQKSGY